MPFNGAGVYSAPAADFPAVTQTVISSTHYNNVINDIATALSLCLTKDGQQTATANIPFGGFRATNVGITAVAGSAAVPAINVSDTGTGLYRSAASELAVSIAGIQVARFDSTGLIVTGLITLSGALSVTQLTLTTAASRIIPGVTSLSLRNNANNADNWLLTDAGNGTLRGNLVVSGTGSHAIGGVVDTSIQLSVLGSFTGATNAQGLSVTSTLIPPVSGNASGVSVNPTLNKAGSGTHVDFVGLQVTAPTIGAGAATLTNATTVKIVGAPSVGTNQRALWVTAGMVQFDGTSLVLGASPTISVASGNLTITPSVVLTGGIVGSILSTSPTGGIGYTTGAGGSVIQSTNKSTGVTLNTVTGQITMSGAALAGNTEVEFFLTNSTITATDVLVLNHKSAGTFGAYSLQAQCVAGSATISVKNVTAGSLSEAIVLTFCVVRGVIT